MKFKKTRELKKLLFCCVAVATMALVACGDEKENPAEVYAGTYTITGMAHLNGIPVVGSYDTDIPETEATIALADENGNVTVTMGDYSTTGYVNEAGLHLDPIIVNTNILNTDVSVTGTFPVVPAPVDGVTSCTATLTVSIMGVTVNGTADITAKKK